MNQGSWFLQAQLLKSSRDHIPFGIGRSWYKAPSLEKQGKKQSLNHPPVSRTKILAVYCQEGGKEVSPLSLGNSSC